MYKGYITFIIQLLRLYFMLQLAIFLVNKIKFIKIYRENLSGAILPQMRRIKTKSRRERKNTSFRFALANL